MSSIVIDLPDEDLRLLDAMEDVQKKPRAEIISAVISGYLKNNRNYDRAFGIWNLENGDGLTFQRTLREEWPE